MFIGTLKRGTILIVFKNTFKNRLQNIFKYVVIAVATFSTTVLYANTYNGVKYDAKQIECLARASYHEANGEGKQGMLAVIHVTLNRVNDPRFPKSPCSVIAQPNQYSWYRHKPKVRDYETYDVAKQLAKEVVEGKHKDNTGKAVFFHARYVTPSWSKKLKCSAVIGQHRFYK